jgi:hypothetical protein
MALNSKFHDSLYGGVTWTSPVTLVRLPWNIPLLTNWLEVLLIQIYKVEYLNPCLVHPVALDINKKNEPPLFLDILCMQYLRMAYVGRNM